MDFADRILVLASSTCPAKVVSKSTADAGIKLNVGAVVGLLLWLSLAIAARPAGAQSYWSAPSDSFEYSLDAIHATEGGAVLVGDSFSGLYRSVDQGSTWHLVNEAWTRGFAEADGFVYAVTVNEGVLRSGDDGATWTQVLLNGGYGISVDGAQVVSGGTGGQLYYSPDRGATWSLLNCSIIPDGLDDTVYAPFIAGDLVLYRHSFDGLFRTPDGGATWDRQDRVPDFIAGYNGALFTTEGRTIFRSIDGTTWSTYATTPFFSADDLDMRGARWGLASFSGVAVSDDEGKTWRDVTNGLVDTDAEAIAIDTAGYVYAMLDYQVQRSAEPVGMSTAAETGSRARVTTRLLEAYPNPAAGAFDVPLILGERSRVEAAVYDALGRRVEVLLDREMPPGRHVLRWRAPRLASGTYFVRIQAGGQVLSRPIVLAK